MKNKKYKIVIIEKESPFKELLFKLLQYEIYKNNYSNISITDECNVKGEKSYNKKIDMLFIDAMFIDESKIEVIKKLKLKNPNLIIVILISEQGASYIKSIIDRQKELSQYFVDEFILKDNYSVGLLVVFCDTLIKKMLSLK